MSKYCGATAPKKSLGRQYPLNLDSQWVNSEYKRNFTWHDGYQATKVDVVRNAPSVRAADENSNKISENREKLLPAVGKYSY
ncbi:hypothetical protein CEXT_27241 [Caerostris extrusa]|uniref:Transposase n=1 Tax=Caerostris extrusa TaxID=172846 RepID=A0AAV4WVY5_CAEEX|nr:hypothetical protein CEXT_27241 [Caerostris extrusa]